MPSRNRDNATSKQDMGYSEQKSLCWQKEVSQQSIGTQPKLLRDLCEKKHNYSLDGATSLVCSQGPKMTSTRTYYGNGAKDEELVLEESHFDYII